jgi:hypothetical protein
MIGWKQTLGPRIVVWIQLSTSRAFSWDSPNSRVTWRECSLHSRSCGARTLRMRFPISSAVKCYVSCSTGTLLQAAKYISVWMTSTTIELGIFCAAARARLLQVPRVKSMFQYSACVYCIIIWSQLSLPVHCILGTPNNVLPITVINITSSQLSVTCIWKTRSVRTSVL